MDVTSWFVALRGPCYTASSLTVSRDRTWIENRWILIKDGQQREFEVGHRLYDGTGLRTLLLDAGFESVDLYGDLSGAPYDTNARRLVAVARKAITAS